MPHSLVFVPVRVAVGVPLPAVRYVLEPLVADLVRDQLDRRANGHEFRASAPEVAVNPTFPSRAASVPAIIRPKPVKIAFYCEHCWKFLPYDPEREARASAPSPWILCDPCEEREARRRSELESELQQLVEMWSLRTCATDD